MDSFTLEVDGHFLGRYLEPRSSGSVVQTVVFGMEKTRDGPCQGRHRLPHLSGPRGMGSLTSLSS